MSDNSLANDPITKAIANSLAPIALESFNSTGSVTGNSLFSFYTVDAAFKKKINQAGLSEDFSKVTEKLVNSGVEDPELGVMNHDGFEASYPEGVHERASEILAEHLKANY